MRSSTIEHRIQGIHDEIDRLLEDIANEQILAEQKLAQLDREALSLHYRIATAAEHAKQLQALRDILDA